MLFPHDPISLSQSHKGYHKFVLVAKKSIATAIDSTHTWVVVDHSIHTHPPPSCNPFIHTPSSQSPVSSQQSV